MSGPFETAIVKAEADVAEQRQLAEQRQAEERIQAEARTRKLQERFGTMKVAVAAKAEALAARKFFAIEEVDAERFDYGLLLKGGRKRIALKAKERGGYRMYIYWEGARTEEGWIETIDDHNPKTIDELMSTLGDWLVRFGKTEP